jgi:hypothetical protein
MQLIKCSSFDGRQSEANGVDQEKETEEEGDKSRKIKRRETNCYNCLWQEYYILPTNYYGIKILNEYLI